MTAQYSPIICLVSPFPAEFDEPSALVVLLEEELVVIDLQTPGWPSLPTPYLAPLHSSAITCSFHITSVPPKLWERLVNAGKAQQSRQHVHRVRSTLNHSLIDFVTCGHLNVFHLLKTHSSVPLGLNINLISTQYQ